MFIYTLLNSTLIFAALADKKCLIERNSHSDSLLVRIENCPFGKDFGNSNVQKFYDMLLFCKKEEEVRKYIVLCLSNSFGKEGREMEAGGQKRKKGRKGEKEGEGGKRERKRKKGKGKEGEPERRGESRK